MKGEPMSDFAKDTNVPTNDCISRQAAIDIAYPFDDNERNLIDALEELPTAQQWIPCSERLPDERQDVYVTVLWDDYGDYITAYGMRTRFGWYLHSNAEGELIKGYMVIAWMPLPEPYKGEES